MDITLVKVKTKGLYEWGSGMLTSKSKIWTDYWNNYKKIFWKTVTKDGGTYLVSVYGGGMIHPMDFRIVVARPHSDLKREIAELDEAMRELSQKLSFTYEIHLREYRGLDDNAPDIPYSTEKGLAPSVAAKELPDAEDAPFVRYDDPPDRSAMTSGEPPYKAELVWSANGKQAWRSIKAYDSEVKAAKALLAQARKMKMHVQEYTRHWIEPKDPGDPGSVPAHMIDFGSYTYYGKITSMKEKHGSGNN